MAVRRRDSDGGVPPQSCIPDTEDIIIIDYKIDRSRRERLPSITLVICKIQRRL